MDYARVGRYTVWLWVFAVVWSTLARAEAIHTAVTSDGVVEGLEERGIAVFRGIPYAQPPVGPLRWQPPRPASAYPEPLQAHTYGPRCMQRNSGDRPAAVSEDCLTLNVWSKQLQPAKQPVMVWIHGVVFVVVRAKSLVRLWRGTGSLWCPLLIDWAPLAFLRTRPWGLVQRVLACWI